MLLPLSACPWVLLCKPLLLLCVYVSLWLFSANLLLRLGDLAGHGIAIATKDIYDKAFGDRMFRSPLTELLLKSGRNGMPFAIAFAIFSCNICCFRQNQWERILYIPKGKQTKT